MEGLRIIEPLGNLDIRRQFADLAARGLGNGMIDLVQINKNRNYLSNINIVGSGTPIETKESRRSRGGKRD